MLEVDENLQKAGVMSTRHYYKNDPILGNIFTASIFFDKDRKILARGVAICSVKDSHNKKFAREKSKSRAITALFKKTNSLPIMPFDMDKEGISPSKREFEYHIKSFKLNKKDEDFKDKKEALMDEISKHDTLGDVVVQDFEHFEKISVYIPYTLPIEETLTHFKFKSEFEPTPTDEEKVMFKL
jgi:hypothetical protein